MHPNPSSSMEAEEFLDLYDSAWFEAEIFKRQSIASKLSTFAANPHLQKLEKSGEPEISRIPSAIYRSMSEQLDIETIFSGCPFSPDSVLFASKLTTILSGRETKGGGGEEGEETVSNMERACREESRKKKVTRLRRGKKTATKSMSELEYDELKGFMDLGFVFSEEHMDSSLVSILPGLQRLGKKDGSDNEADESAVPRPYLSEAWEGAERRKPNPLRKWRIPASSSEVEMKDSLKMWAQTVASSVR